ncbi:MAG TPA: DUF6274 family protein [Mycobacterium sp.]|nr:DUF6274 family protein [Mycobacterium sp.]
MKCAKGWRCWQSTCATCNRLRRLAMDPVGVERGRQAVERVESERRVIEVEREVDEEGWN